MRPNHRSRVLRAAFPSILPSALVVALVAAASLAAFPADAADTSLKVLMKKMQAQVVNGDAKALAPIFEETKAKGRPEYTSWNALADKGKAAAEKGDLEGAKATCKQCHDAHRSDYRAKYGSKAP
jgi:hypothetical protein